MTPKIMLATLCLNEIEWLPELYEQHKEWPGLYGSKWVFVEAADMVYANTNPGMVTPLGLSVDGTSEFLTHLAEKDPGVTYIPHGFSHHSDKAQGKIAARNRYLEIADEMKPDFVIVVDADEFYTVEAQRIITNAITERALRRVNGFMFPQHHVWRPESCIEQPLFKEEVVGGYWDIPHCRVWRYIPKMRYTANHNSPSPTGMIHSARSASCIHMGFAASRKTRAAKHEYYKARGEGVTDKRQMYVDCRAAFETFTPGERLPHKARIIPFTHAIPECFI